MPSAWPVRLAWLLIYALGLAVVGAMVAVYFVVVDLSDRTEELDGLGVVLGTLGFLAALAAAAIAWTARWLVRSGERARVIIGSAIAALLSLLLMNYLIPTRAEDLVATVLVGLPGLALAGCAVMTLVEELRSKGA